MSRDKTETTETETPNVRMREFARHEREEGTHPAIKTLRNRPRAEGDSGRQTEEFVRIERGRQA